MSAINQWKDRLSGHNREIEIVFDELKLRGHELSAAEANDLVASARAIELGAQRVFKSLDEIAKKKI